jgi:LacI family transcriptional regulator
VGNRMVSKTISSVYVDIEKAVFELVTKYLETDVRDIAIMQDRKNNNQIDFMIKGAEKAFAAKGLKFDNYITIPDEFRTSYQYLSRYFKDHRHGLIIANRDSQALAILNAARENGIRVPEDMEVVCVIDTKYNSMFRPQVSSFAIPSYDLGSVSMRVMTKMLNHAQEGKAIELSYLFTPRQTTK